MKMRMLAVLLFLSAGVINVLAQDESQCNTNSSISHEAVKAGNFKDAYAPWKAVMNDCPVLRYYTYTDGYKILKSFLGEHAKNSAEYKTSFDELMWVYDQLIKYTPDFLNKNVKVPSVARTLTNKGMDYVQFAPDVDPNVAYGMFKESTDGEGAQSSPNSFFFLLQMSLEKLKKDDSHKEQFIQDYLNTSEWTAEAMGSASDDKLKNALSAIKDNLDALFINSGAADCASLQEIYAPKVEENKTDQEYLKKVIDIMRMMRCTDQEVYSQASYYSYQIQPTAEAAAGCATMAYKRGDLDGAIKFFDEAIQLESDDLKKADFSYRTAAVLYEAKRFGQSRTYAQRAINYNPNLGGAYILIATLYASSPKWSDEGVLNKCTYYLVIDKLQKARAVDSSVADEANRLINTYSAYLPAASDLFMLGYKAGDTITIGGWIGETTRIR